MNLDSILHTIMHRAYKADVPPDWWADSQQLGALLQGQWNHVTHDYLLRVTGAVHDKDIAAIEGLVTEAKGLKFDLSGHAAERVQAFLDTVQNRAVAAYALHGKHDLSIDRIKEFDGDYKRFLNDMHAEQIRMFCAANPGRILHPELERQVQYIRDTDLSRSVDVDLVAQRLERIIKQEPYWQGLSDVQVARLWHHDGLKLADENGVIECYVSGPDDPNTCWVCRRMLGTRLDVKQSLAKFERDGGLTDPDEYVKAWPFPRYMDLDNISPEDRSTIGGAPPYHGA